MIERFSLKEKVILLTGGAGLYGRGLTADLAAAGATLIIASRNIDKCEEVANHECRLGHRVIAEHFDQASEQSIKSLLERILAAHGRVDGVVNNSMLRPMNIDHHPITGFDESMHVNATGIFLMHHYFGNAMAENRDGSIVNISSIQGMIGPNLNLYADTDMGTPCPDYFFHKGGMINLARYYASILGPRNVRVNCLAPGGYFNNQPEPFIQRYKDQTFLGRMADDKDLGGAVVFLLSEASRYITGAVLPVDGGYTAK